MAGDPTTKQRNTIREHRERGLRAYYKGNRLVVTGPLHYHPINRDSFANAARRGASRGGFNPGDGRHTARQQGNPGDGSHSARQQGNPRDGRHTARQLGNPGDGSHTARQQGNPGTNRHQSGRPREEYDSRPYHSEDGSSHWSGGTRHSGDNRTTDWQNEYRGNIDNHHYDPRTRQYYNSGSSRDRDTEWYDQRPYPDWQDYDRRPNAFPSLDMPARNSRNLTPVAAQSDGDTSHQRHQPPATPATRENSTATKETPWGRGLQRQSPRLQTRKHRSAAHPPSCNQKGVPLKTVRSQLQRGQKNPATKMSERGGGGGGGGGRQQRHRPLVTRQWKTHKLPIRKTTQQTGILHRETPRQRDTPTADSDAKFHDAEESLEDTEGTESACTGLENTRMTTIAPTRHDAESADAENTQVTTTAPTCPDAKSADAETPECSRPTTEPCTQGTDVTDLTAK